MSRKIFEYGGWIAGAALVLFGIAAIAMGINGRSEVRSALSDQKITATPDAAQITNGKLQPGEPITNGAEARQFAKVMEHHALEATQGQRYAEMGRFLDVEGQPTNDEAKAAKDQKTGQPVENGLRNLWVTETALTTALNMSFMAEQLSLFGIVVGVALLLTGIGFLVLSIGGALRKAPAGQTAVAGKVAAAIS